MTPRSVRRPISRPHVVASQAAAEPPSFQSSFQAAQARLRGTGHGETAIANAQAAVDVGKNRPLGNRNPSTMLGEVLENQREILRRIDALGSSTIETKRELRGLQQMIASEFGVGVAAEPEGASDSEPEREGEPEPIDETEAIGDEPTETELPSAS